MIIQKTFLTQQTSAIGFSTFVAPNPPDGIPRIFRVSAYISTNSSANVGSLVAVVSWDDSNGQGVSNPATIATASYAGAYSSGSALVPFEVGQTANISVFVQDSTGAAVPAGTTFETLVVVEEL